MLVEAIKREVIDYLVCRTCGVVFADRTNPRDPKNCPICGVTKENFAPYEEKTQ